MENPIDPCPQSNALPEQAETIPWEQRKAIGGLKALWQTWLLSVTDPKQLFSRIPCEPLTEKHEPRDFLEPLFYGGIMTAVFCVMTLIYQQKKVQLLDRLWFIVPGIVMGVIMLCLYGVIVQRLLIKLNAARCGALCTFRMICYSMGVTLFGIIPYAGGFISLIWGVYLLMLGLSEVHRIERSKALQIAITAYAILVGVLFLVTIGSTCMVGPWLRF